MARIKGKGAVSSEGSDDAKPKRTPKDRRDWTVKFLADLVESGTVSHAARKAGIDRTTAYNRREVDPTFAAAWDDAVEQAIDDGEVELRRRGVKGVEEAVYHAGAKVGSVRRYDTTALIFWLKGKRPAVWREPRGVTVNLPPAQETLPQPKAAAMLHAAMKEMIRIEWEERSESDKADRLRWAAYAKHHGQPINGIDGYDGPIPDWVGPPAPAEAEATQPDQTSQSIHGSGSAYLDEG